jgi:hypothetical protein
VVTVKIVEGMHYWAQGLSTAFRFFVDTLLEKLRSGAV